MRGATMDLSTSISHQGLYISAYNSSQRISFSSFLPRRNLFGSTRNKGIWTCCTLDDHSKNSSPPSSPSSATVDQTKCLPQDPLGDGNSSSINVVEGLTINTNGLIALASTAAAVSLFSLTHGVVTGVSLTDVVANALPYEEALTNHKPTVVEFYADWCEVCRELAPDLYKVEQEYKDRINFVMLNVDNNKWEEELDEFGVEGIPHFAFLDKLGNEEGNMVGRLPKKYFLENVDALARGAESIPHTSVIGKFSKADSRHTSSIAEPRSHGNF